MTRPIKSVGAWPRLLLALSLVLIAPPAWADGLAEPPDAPPGETSFDTMRTLDGASTGDLSDRVAPSEAWSGPRLLGVQFGAGAVAAAVSVPLTLWGASAVGTLSNNLFGAALPSLLMLLVLPPLAVTLAEVLVGKALGADPKLFPALWVALGTQLVAIAGGVLLGLYAGNPTHVALFTLGEALLLPTATTLMLGLSSQSATPPLSTGPERSFRMLPPVVSMPLFQGSF